MESGRREELQKGWIRAEKTAYFQCCWRKQIFVWENGGSFLGEGWKEYLQSEEFREIMWSPVVLGSIVKGMLEYRRQEEAALFFWYLYDFEKMGEENCKGQSLQLFKCLYPAYTNSVKRRQYAESKYERKREGRKRVYRTIAGGAGLLFIFLVMLYINADITLAVFGIVLIPFIFKQAPLPVANKPISENERIHFKRRVKQLYSIELMTTVILLYFGEVSCALAILAVHVVLFIMVLMQMLSNWKAARTVE